MPVDLGVGSFTSRLTRMLGAKGRVPLKLDEVGVCAFTMLNADGAPYRIEERAWKANVLMPAQVGQFCTAGIEAPSDNKLVVLIDYAEVRSVTPGLAQGVRAGTRFIDTPQTNNLTYWRDAFFKTGNVGSTFLRSPVNLVSYLAGAPSLVGTQEWFNSAVAIANYFLGLEGIGSDEEPMVTLGPLEFFALTNGIVNSAAHFLFMGRLFRFLDNLTAGG